MIESIDLYLPRIIVRILPLREHETPFRDLSILLIMVRNLPLGTLTETRPDTFVRSEIPSNARIPCEMQIQRRYQLHAVFGALKFPSFLITVTFHESSYPGSIYPR